MTRRPYERFLLQASPDALLDADDRVAAAMLSRWWLYGKLHPGLLHWRRQQLVFAAQTICPACASGCGVVPRETLEELLSGVDPENTDDATAEICNPAESVPAH